MTEIKRGELKILGQKNIRIVLGLLPAKIKEPVLTHHMVGCWSVTVTSHLSLIWNSG